MPCLFAAGILILPRLTIAWLWFMTNWFTGLFDSLLWPILGFIFAPTTLLWFTVVQNVFQGIWGTWQIVGMVIAVLIDMSPSRGKKRNSSSRS